MTDYNAIKDVFEKNGWTWNLDGEQRTPNWEDIEATIAKMKVVLDDSQELEAQITVGHLIMQRSYDYYDVYVHVGTLDGPED